MASIVVFAACLAAIRANYRARLYGDTAVVKVLPVADRTPEGMAAHARRMVSQEILSRALLDPRLSGLNQPLRAADPDEAIGSLPGPQVYAHVDSVEDGTLSVDSVAEGSAAEATSIALAIADAFIADEGANRVVPWTAGIPTGCTFQLRPLGEPWELATAVALAVLASSLALVVPTAWLTPWRCMPLAVVMRLPRVRFTVRRMMLLVAAVGVLLGAYRWNPGLGIWALSLEWMALGRTFMLIDRRRDAGGRVTLRDGARLLLGSLGVALTICGGSGAAFLGCLLVTVVPFWHPDPGCNVEPMEWFIPYGLVISACVAVVAASHLKRRPWPYDPDSPSRRDL
jgi:hypothetical protein